MLGKVLVTKPVFPEAIHFLKQQAVDIDANPEDRVLIKTGTDRATAGKAGRSHPADRHY